jgi:hypothetical protein
MHISAWGVLSIFETDKTNMQIFLHVDHYIGKEKQAYLLSLFGGDAEAGAIRVAIYEKHTFTLAFPNASLGSELYQSIRSRIA